MTQSPSRSKIFGYAIGEGAVAVTMNGISNFALLYYTQVLGLGAASAGLALGIAMLWDAITDPIMGHASDRTRSRFGRRHVYIVLGGVALAITYFLLWQVPALFATDNMIFVVVVGTNILIRTAVTVYGVPYMALGFEMCRDYVGQSRIQGARAFVNQISNFVFGAMAWSLFFRDGTTPEGGRVDGTSVAANYLVMGTSIAVAAIVMIGICVYSTRHLAVDNRSSTGGGSRDSLGFWKDISAIGRDHLVWLVFGFFAVAQFGMMVTAQAQMFTYVFFMELTADEKTFVHGSGMLAFAGGALLQGWLTRLYDKKTTGYIGMAVCVVSGVLLAVAFFSAGLLPRSELAFLGLDLPLGILVFTLGQSLWWGGAGILAPLSVSMVADISEINFLKTGVSKDGSYAAIFTFTLKACMSVGLILVGWMVEASGIVAGASGQTEEAVRSITLITFLFGPALVFVSFFILRRYPVDRHFMAALTQNAIYRR